MILRFVAVLVVVLAAVVAVFAQPYDPKAVFYSDSVLSKALSDISQMQEPELRAFTHYLAECQDAADAVSKHFCAAARASYQIEFGAKRALDDMMIARSILDDLSQTKPALDMNDPIKTVNAAKKAALVLVALERAAGERFHALKPSRK
jgi:hypothetical protein